jgi:hypothetical protein
MAKTHRDVAINQTIVTTVEKNSFDETSETTECLHCLESRLAITDVIAPATS